MALIYLIMISGVALFIVGIVLALREPPEVTKGETPPQGAMPPGTEPFSLGTRITDVLSTMQHGLSGYKLKIQEQEEKLKKLLSEQEEGKKLFAKKGGELAETKAKLEESEKLRTQAEERVEQLKQEGLDLKKLADESELSKRQLEEKSKQLEEAEKSKREAEERATQLDQWMNELRKTVKNSESLRLQAEQKMKQLEQENSELKKPLEKKELQPPDRA